MKLALVTGGHRRLGAAISQRLARDGFEVSPRLAGFIAATRGQARTRWADAYFTKADGTRYVAGDLLRNPAYAETVAELAAGGAQGFYNGRVARAIAATVAEEPRPGALTAQDIADYELTVASLLTRVTLAAPYRT